MQKGNREDVGLSLEAKRGRSQMGLLDMLGVPVAFALWLFVLEDFRSEPVAVIVFWTIAIAAGICGHLVYMFWLPWRGTVVLGFAVLSVIAFSAVATFAGAEDGGFDVLTLPIDFFARQVGSKRTWYTLFAFASCAALTSAHPVRPSFVTAIISALGISMWYAMVILIAANAG